MKKLLILLILPVQIAFGQAEVQLDSCYVWARHHYPNLRNSELWQEITSLQQANHETNYLPQLALKGQATYQSDVTEVPTILPNVSIPTLSKDQYKAYAELQQTIWDGGVTKASKELENAILESNLSQLEVELYQLNEKVAQAFFTGLVVDQQREVIKAQLKTLDVQLKQVNSAVINGAMERSSLLVLKAERLNFEQNLIELKTAKRASIQVLSIFTGKAISEQSELSYNRINTNYNSNFLRPELQLYALQKNQLNTQINLLDKTRNPKLYGFGQLGYGRPGLNMLLDEFKGYYLLGIGVSWKAFDWKNTARQKEILQVQQKMLQNQENTFIQNLELLLVQQKEQISKLEKLLQNDDKIVTLRTDITKATASKLENKTITTSDYVRELQAETVARINLELHKIQLNEALEKYNLIKGKTSVSR